MVTAWVSVSTARGIHSSPASARARSVRVAWTDRQARGGAHVPSIMVPAPR
jgi:hypothetical protein